MTFIPEFYFLFFILFIFFYFILFNYSSLFNYPIINDYVYYYQILIIVNTLFLIGTELDTNIFFSVDLFNKSDFTRLLEFFFFFLFFFFVVGVYYYNNILNISSGEFFLIVSICFFSINCIINTYNLMLFFIFLELISLCLYIICSFNKRDIYSIEAGLKYFILGSFSSLLILFGIIFLYAYTGFFFITDLKNILSIFIIFKSDFFFIGILTSLIFIIVGLLFKIYSAPFHFWVADIYDGAPLSASFFFSVISLVSIVYYFFFFYFSICIYFHFFFKVLLLIVSISSIFFGIFGTLVQRKIRRFIAYSSVTTIGYLLISLAYLDFDFFESSLSYFFFYILNLACLFFFLLNVSFNKNIFFSNISDFSLLYNNEKMLSVLISIFYFSISGLPPFELFFKKVSFFFSFSKNINFFFFFFLLYLLFLLIFIIYEL